MQRQQQRKSSFIARLLACVALIPVLGASADDLEDRINTSEMPVDEARLLAEVLHKVHDEYVDQTTYEDLIDLAIHGLVTGLDSHSAFLDPAEYEEILISTAGSYSGVGLEISVVNDQVVVISPFDGTPARRAGIRSGDIIISIDDMPVVHDNLRETIVRMRGEPGSHVNIVVSRVGVEEPLKFDLTRTYIRMASVKAKLLEPGYGYLRISQFSENTGAELNDALHELMAEAGGYLDGLVLDLRNNPGGVLDSAVDVADSFLSSGLVVSAFGRADDARFSRWAKKGDLLEGARMAVLVNGGSASASEIVAGALQDLDRAIIVGQQTFGKGTVQTVMPLSGGRALKLTTSRFFTPSGGSISERGIMPDVLVIPNDEESIALKALTGSIDAEALAGDNQLGTALATIKQRTILHSRAE